MSATNITLTIKHIESRNTNSALKAQFNTQWAKKTLPRNDICDNLYKPVSGNKLALQKLHWNLWITNLLIE